MLFLTSATSDIIEVITASAVSTIHVHATFIDRGGSNINGNRQNTLITGNATTTIVSAPNGSPVTDRCVQTITIRNNNASSSNAITVRHNNGTATELIKYTLLPGETLQYFGQGNGTWSVFSVSGGIKNVAAFSDGRLLAYNLLTSGTTFTTGANTKWIYVRMVGGGGQGGGTTGVAASTSGAGSGGAAGSYLEAWLPVLPSTTYTYAIGAGGSTGGANANGQAGGNTTFTIPGGRVLTATGGGGGNNTGANSFFIGTPGGVNTVSTGGDFNSGGSEGGIGWRGSDGVTAWGGLGGSSFFGAGAQSVTPNNNGNAATVGFGAGGGGAASNSGSTTGGAGTGGCIVIMEFS